MTNKNTEYEKLVAELLQGMLNYDGFETLRVEHDVKIVGKSKAEHQIDVFWEFKAAGTTYRTCVECKNYSSRVKKQHVAAFASIIEDIGNANGVIATTSGYQKGAKLLADQKNIRLVHVNYLLKSIHIHMTPVITNYDAVSFKFNQESIKEALIRNGLEKLDANFQIHGEYELKDANGNNSKSLNAFLREAKLQEGDNSICAEGLFFDFEEIGLVEFDEIRVKVSYSNAPVMESIINYPHSSKAVLEDIVDNNKHYLHDDGSVSASINRAKNSEKPLGINDGT